MTWFHTPAISPEQGALALIAIAIVYGLVWVVSKMLTYREPVEPDPHEYADGEASALKLRHGAASRGRRTREHRIWTAMRQRCLNPADRAYAYYGARGITVCERWSDFEAFLTDMGHCPSPDHQIDRINNDGPYSPDNCRWATRVEQMRNTRGVRAVVRSDGKQYATIVEAANDTNISIHGISACCRGKQKLSGEYGWSYAAAALRAMKEEGR